LTILNYFKNELVLLIIFKLTYVSLERLNKTGRENKIQQKMVGKSPLCTGIVAQFEIINSRYKEQQDFDGGAVYSFFTFTT
jgi:hypothetical protein